MTSVFACCSLSRRSLQTPITKSFQALMIKTVRVCPFLRILFLELSSVLMSMSCVYICRLRTLSPGRGDMRSSSTKQPRNPHIKPQQPRPRRIKTLPRRSNNSRPCPATPCSRAPAASRRRLLRATTGPRPEPTGLRWPPRLCRHTRHSHRLVTMSPLCYNLHIIVSLLIICRVQASLAALCISIV